MIELFSRHASLKSLGLRQWYSKYTLSNAPLSPKLIIPIIKSHENVLVGHGSDLLSDYEPKLKKISSVLSSNELSDAGLLVSKSIVNNGESDNGKSLSDPVEVAKDILGDKLNDSLSLSFMRFDKCIVLYEVSSSSDKVLETLLLESIIQVIDRLNTRVVQENTPLYWPVFESRALRNSQALSFQSVLKCWLKFQDWSDCSYLFYFGENFDGLESSLLDVEVIKDSSCKLLSFKFSLSTLLVSPTKKKKLWEVFSAAGVVVG